MKFPNVQSRSCFHAMNLTYVKTCWAWKNAGLLRSGNEVYLNISKRPLQLGFLRGSN